MGLNEVSDLGLFRMFKYLSHIKNFPTSLRAASVVSGVPEETAGTILNQTTMYAGYKVINGEIYSIPQSLRTPA